MPSSTDHIHQANHNRSLATNLSTGTVEYPDWAVTVAFYTALHIVESYFARKRGIHSADHKNRDSNFVSFPELRSVYRNYAELKRLSMKSRYQCQLASWNATEVQNAIKLLNKIESHINTLP